jgi:hypothetical protein
MAKVGDDKNWNVHTEFMLQNENAIAIKRQGGS